MQNSGRSLNKLLRKAYTISPVSCTILRLVVTKIDISLPNVKQSPGVECLNHGNDLKTNHVHYFSV